MKRILIVAMLCVLVGLLYVVSTALQPSKPATNQDKYADIMKTQSGRFKQEDDDRKQRIEMLHKAGLKTGGGVKDPSTLNGMGAGKDSGYMESDWASKRNSGQGGLDEIGSQNRK